MIFELGERHLLRFDVAGRLDGEFDARLASQRRISPETVLEAEPERPIAGVSRLGAEPCFGKDALRLPPLRQCAATDADVHEHTWRGMERGTIREKVRIAGAADVPACDLFVRHRRLNDTLGARSRAWAIDAFGGNLWRIRCRKRRGERSPWDDARDEERGER